jgi:D-alanine-D-alanine ligase
MITDILNRGKIKVGILRGGPSHEYEVSLKTGANVLANLSEQYLPQDIFISRDGDWHIDGRVRTPEKALSQVDVVFNALHGKYGEDGKVQKILDALKKPYTGSQSFQSSLGMHKGLTKKVFELHGIKSPHYIELKPRDNSWNRIVEIFQSFPQPSIVKPISGGSSVATTIARDFATFEKAVENAFRHSGGVIVEEFIQGREATCGILDSADSKQAYALFPIEIIAPKEKTFFDYDAKYANVSQEVCPSDFDVNTKKEIQELALAMHMALGLRHYSRSDFIISPNRGIYALETNSLPGLTAESLYPKSLYAAQISFPEFLDHVLKLALS